jgi:GNAT superfamily N-acetyltransferase
MNRLIEIGFQLAGHWQLDGGQVTFKLDRFAADSNILYAFVCDGEVMYVGKTIQSLQKRMYGYKRPGKSQSTNIKIQSLIDECLHQGTAVDILALPDNGLLHYGQFHVNLAAGLEDNVIALLRPAWNGLPKRVVLDRLDAEKEMVVPVDTFEFTLQQTYFNKGFFNVPIAHAGGFGDDGQEIEIFCGDGAQAIRGIINRTANANRTPRIFGGVALRDGATVTVRPLTATDELSIRRLLAGLSDESRVLRFFSAGASMERAATAMAALTPDRGRGLVAVTGNPERIVAHAAYIREAPARAEVAFEVADDWQGLGISTLLLAHLSEQAAADGIDTFTAVVLPDNRRMIQVFRDSGFAVKVRSEPGELLVELPAELGPDARARFEERDHVAAAAAVAHVLRPGSVAVIGSSTRNGSVGAAVLGNLRAAGYQGRLHVVHPREAMIDGVPTHRSVAEIPEPVELAVIAPDSNRSATARSITTSQPLWVEEVEFGDGTSGFATDGTPVDCVRFATLGLIGFVPDFVLIHHLTEGTKKLSAWHRGRIAAFSSGGGAGKEIMVGDVIQGATNTGRRALVREVHLTTGSWAGGDAAGWLAWNAEDENATFGSENVDILDRSGSSVARGGGIQIADAGTVTAQSELANAAITSAYALVTPANGIQPYVGSAAANAKGFTITATLSVANELVAFQAWRNDPANPRPVLA